jgi:hypothetical protein
MPDPAAGGMPSAVAGGGAGLVGGAGGEGGEGGGEPVVVSKDIDGSVYGVSDELVILVDGVNVPIGADGHFMVTDGPDEYQLQVCAPNYKFVLIFDGLRTRTPVVNLNTGLGDPPYAATIRGKVTGGLSTPFPVADDETVFTELAYSSYANGYLYPRSSIDPPEGFDLNPLWFGSDTDTGEVLAIQYIFKNKVGLTEYTGFARRPMTITDGNIYGSVNGSAATDLEFTVPTVSTLTGSLNLPSSWTLRSTFVHVGPFMPDGILAGDFSIPVPQLENMPMWLSFQAEGPEGDADYVLPLPEQSPWNITVPTPAKALLPVANANAVTQSTIFSWNGLPANAVAGIYWSVGDWNIERFTTAASTTIPDLSALGVTLPANADGLWVIKAVGPAEKMDDVLTAIHVHDLDVGKPSFYLDSPTRAFTTAP